MTPEVFDRRVYIARLRAAIADAGLSESEVARAAGIDKSQFSKYLNGRVDPTLTTIERIEQALAALRTGD